MVRSEFGVNIVKAHQQSCLISTIQVGSRTVMVWGECFGPLFTMFIPLPHIIWRLLPEDNTLCHKSHVTRSQFNRAFICGTMGDLYHGCAANKSEAMLCILLDLCHEWRQVWRKNKVQASSSNLYLLKRVMSVYWRRRAFSLIILPKCCLFQEVQLLL